MASQQMFQCQIDEGQMDDDCDDGYGFSYATPIPPDGPINGMTSKVLIGALSNELKAMVQEPLTHSSLNQISRFANIAQELIMVRSPIADVRQRKRPRLPVGVPGGGVSMSGPYSPNYNINPDPVIGGTGYPLEENALTGEAAPNETFGAKLVRELIPALSNINKSEEREKGVFEDLVDGIAAAREKGLDDVAESLQKKLDSLANVGAKIIEAENASTPKSLPPQPASETSP